MINRQYSSISIILATMALLAAILACNDDRREAIETVFEQYYLIDPSSLLGAMAQGKDDLFTPVDTEPELPPPAQQVPVDWQQVDYILIAEALSKEAWSDTLDGWSLKSVHFALGCTKTDYGFQNAYFRYFKNVNLANRGIRIERYIDIDPRSKSTYLSESEYSPRLTDWGSIDLAKLLISADEALTIAEDHGGQEKRLSVQNACDISLLLSPDSAGYRGWDVWYSSKGQEQIFRIQIDPATGEIH